MNYDDEYCPEPFGPEYVRPASKPCPDCECCSARLCELAASMPTLDQNCAYHGDHDLWEQLAACPCPRASWTDAQRSGDACVFCGSAVDRADISSRVMVGMNGGLVAACVPCMDAHRAAVRAGADGSGATR